MITNKVEMQDVMTKGVGEVLRTMTLTREQLGNGSNADILWALCDHFRDQGRVIASLTAMKLANTARALEVK